MMKSLGIGAAVLCAATTPVLAQSGPMGFTGHWRVAGVAVSDTGVQALSDNDPSLMGKRLTFTLQRLAWDRPTSTNDSCVGPIFTRLSRMPSADLQPELRKLGMREPVAYRLRCGSGSWGPGNGMVVYQGAAGAIAMPWYDGGVLKLVR